MIVYAKVRPNGEYHSHNIAHAVYGFREMGFEIVKYEKIKDIYDLVTKEDIVLDYISQCLIIFDKFAVHPHLEDYPEVLKPYMGRNVWTDTIDSINTTPEKWGIFVKPRKEKAFTGKVINSPKDLIGCGSCYENYEVYCSEKVDILREWRGFIYYDKLIDLRPYNGNWCFNYDSNVIDKAVKSFIKWKDRPVACSLDFALISKSVFYDNNGNVVDYETDCESEIQQTIFLEANDAYALGNYGLHHIMYAKMISARWSQLLEREDECKFEVYYGTG